MIDVKICGVTRVEDALAAESAGASAVGMVFAPGPRRVTIGQAAAICSALGPAVVRVGVFAGSGAEFVRIAAFEAGLDLVQLHGPETPGFIEELGVPAYKAHRAKGESVLDEIRAFGPGAFLLDAHSEGALGGTGLRVDEDLAARAALIGPMILAGGLRPGLAAGAVRRVRPAAVDASSGVESAPGVKDEYLMRRFISEVSGCSRTAGDTSAGTGGGLFRRLSCRR